MMGDAFGQGFFLLDNKTFPKYTGEPSNLQQNSADDLNKYFHDQMRNRKLKSTGVASETVISTTNSLNEILGYKQRQDSRKFGQKPIA